MYVCRASCKVMQPFWRLGKRWHKWPESKFNVAFYLKGHPRMMSHWSFSLMGQIKSNINWCDVIDGWPSGTRGYLRGFFTERKIFYWINWKTWKCQMLFSLFGVLVISGVANLSFPSTPINLKVKYFLVLWTVLKVVRSYGEIV